MMKIRNFLLIILFVLISAHLYCAVNGIGYYKKSSIIENFGKSYKVKSIRIVDDAFEVSFTSNGELSCIYGKTPLKIKSSAKNKIINFLNKVEKPRMIIISKSSDFYIIDFIFVQNGEDIKFSDWLKSNRFTYG